MKSLWCRCVIFSLVLVSCEAFMTPRVALVSHARPATIVRPMAGTVGEIATTVTETTVLETEQLNPAEDPVIYVKPENPLGFAVNQWRGRDLNEFLNIGILTLIAIAVLAKVSLVDQGMMRGWTATEMAMRIPMDNWSDYYQVLTDAPIPTKAVTSATVYTIGDVIAQRTEGTSIGELDRMRVLRSLLAGLIGHGPLSHFWYDLSEGFFTDVLNWTEWWSFFPKVILDQATWAPFWNNSYIILLGLMKRDSFGSMWGDIKRTTVPLIISGLKIWPLAHCITYGLIPVENRLLWVDIVEILWVTILATQAAGGAAAAEDAALAPEES